MAKAKKSRKVNSDAVYARKTASNAGKSNSSNPFSDAKAMTSKKINPFEVHVNREKFHILGRTCKHDKGLPGVSRGKAIKKRAETLGQEYQVKYKSNKFQDRRIGRQFDGDNLPEEVLNARLIAEKMSQLKEKQSRASKFNLDDTEVLTHRGQTLEEIEQFRDERSDDEDMENDKLDANFTEAAHFGGADLQEQQMKDRKSAIEEMIVEQRRRKLEMAKEKDEVHDLTENLDKKYKGMLSVLGKMIHPNEVGPAPKKIVDDYDKVMREMIFEPRGVVTDKLLSEEELAKKEKERLEELEKERLRRMQGDGEDEDVSAKPKHRSADDLDDGYFAMDDAEDEGTLAYHLDGELGTNIKSGHKPEENHSKDASDSEGEGDGEDSDEEDESEEDSDDEEDNLSDLKVSESETDDNECPEEEENQEEKKKTKAAHLLKNGVTESASERSDLPYTIEFPQKYSDFLALLNKYNPEEKGIILGRLIKCNHPKLDGVNRENVTKLFAFLLQYINEIFTDASSEDISMQFEVLDKLNPHMYDLMHLNPERMSSTLLTVIREKYEEYRKNPKLYPSLETVIFFKLVSNYFSTSDFRHPVVSPVYIFTQHILSKARVRTRQDVAIGLLLVTISLEFSHLSKRFIPAALNYLLGVLYLSIPKRPVEVYKIIPPFQNTGPMSKLLGIAEDNDFKNMPEEPLKSEDLVMTTFSTEFKIRALNTALKLIRHAIANLHDNVGTNYFAEPFLCMIEKLKLQAYPEFVVKNVREAKEALERATAKKLVKIVPPEKKPKALRLLEPRIETVYDDKRRPKTSKEKEEKLKLMHKLKRETKGAMREIRRDTEFIQKIRLKQQIQSDMERKEKVKRIYQEASMQQGELNELARAKKRKKF